MDKRFSMIEKEHSKKKIPDFRPGDTVNVQVRITEEGKRRLQSFEGIVIARKGSGLRGTFTVRKISFGEGVEKVFPLYSPAIEKITLVKKGDVSKAKLYYLRKRVGKATKVDEKFEIEVQAKAEDQPDASAREKT